MGEGSETKRQLGRVVLQRRALSPDDLDDGGSNDRPTLPSSSELDLRVLLLTLSEHEEPRRVDLRRVVIPLSVLSFIPSEFARERLILPLFADEERLLVAVAEPSERHTLEEVALSAGRRVLACVPLEGSLRELIEAVYAAERAGARSYRGALVGTAEAPTSPPPIGESLLPPQLEPERAFAEDELSRPLGTAMSPFAPELLRGRSTTPSPLSAGGERRRKLLVVDDSDDIRRLLVRVFREHDYEVFESARGLDALEKVREHEPDVLVLDAMLPELHGFDVCRRIKASRRYGHIPVVMLSAVYRGWRFADDLRHSYGVDEFLEKPFRIGDVLAAVTRALEGTTHAATARDDEDGPGSKQLQAGMEAYERGDIAGAIEQLKQGVELDPLAFRLHYHLGLLYGKQGNVFDAIQALESAVDLKARDFSTLKNLAVLYQRAGFRLKATEMWERALGSAPDDATRASIRNHLVSLL